MTRLELNVTADNLRRVRSMIAEMQEEEARLVEVLKGEMIEQGAETLIGDGWKAAWINVNGSRFDSKAFRADHGDLYAAYTKPTTTTRFTLTA